MGDMSDGGLEQEGAELPCLFRDGLSLEIRRLSRIISSSEEEQDERMAKSSNDAVWSVF